MARLFILALALASVAANDSVNDIDGNPNSFDGGACTSEQTKCKDGACCGKKKWCCKEDKPGAWLSEVEVNGRTCYERSLDGSQTSFCGSMYQCANQIFGTSTTGYLRIGYDQAFDAAASSRAGGIAALLVLGAAVAVAAA